MDNKIHPVKSPINRGSLEAKFDRVKIIFFGTPEFARIVLAKMLNEGDIPECRLQVVAVVTALDKPVGRKQILTPPPVKILAQEKNIPVLQPQKLDEGFINQLKSFKADLFVVASYGKIIPQSVLDIPKYEPLNVHPSLLPKYRGASPIQSAILNNDNETGVTIMVMDAKMDHGKTINNQQLTINKNNTFPELHDKLANLGAELLVKTIPDYINGTIKPQEQNHEQATFCKMIKKENGQINWQNDAQKIYNQWRAFLEWPGVFSQLTTNNQQLTIKFAELALTDVVNTDLEPGEFFVQDKKLFVTCGNHTALEVIQLQPQGKKIMDAQAFINGYLTK